jgi:5'-methylthioadenosine phosphorylase
MPPSSKRARIGVIGGSGLYEILEITDLEEVRLDTPFGQPSDAYHIGTFSGRRVAFLPRHGKGHRITPSELNFRANVYGFKMLGVERIIAAGAVGSMKESIHPLEVVLPDQFIDRTRGRISTFFGGGLVAHVAFAEPICPQLRAMLAQAGSRTKTRVHDGGIYVCMEGPAFSTKAESNLYRSWGADVIGMTALQEAKLAREAEICYATMALVTDYDCWRAGEEHVNVEQILDNLRKNADTARAMLRETVGGLPEERSCGCGSALRTAIITDMSLVPEETRKRLAAILEPLAPTE